MATLYVIWVGWDWDCLQTRISSNIHTKYREHFHRCSTKMYVSRETTDHLVVLMPGSVPAVFLHTWLPFSSPCCGQMVTDVRPANTVQAQHIANCIHLVQPTTTFANTTRKYKCQHIIITSDNKKTKQHNSDTAYSHIYWNLVFILYIKKYIHQRD